jgi:hypothetical protein
MITLRYSSITNVGTTRCSINWTAKAGAKYFLPLEGIVIHINIGGPTFRVTVPRVPWL